MPADFSTAHQLVLANEGGYVNDPQDPGGETYKGVARKIWSAWDGWTNVDLNKRQSGFPGNLEKDHDLQSKVEHFYESNFWNKVHGSDLNDQRIANSIYDFAVNAGSSTSVGLAQSVVDIETNGVMDPVSIDAINKFDPELFLSIFTITKIARYISIVKRRPIHQKYFYGWVRRSLGDI
jgi:lysozyme family protein